MTVDQLTEGETAAFEQRVRAMSPAQKEAKRQQLEALFADEKRRAAAVEELRAQERLIAEKMENLADEWRCCGEALRQVRRQILEVIES